MVAAIAMMIVLGAVLGFGLGIADKYLKVEVDERVEKVTEMLPNYNCGGCGYAGCSGLADALVSGEKAYTVMVDNVTAKENVSRFALHQGYKVSVKEDGEDFVLTLEK